MPIRSPSAVPDALRVSGLHEQPRLTARSLAPCPPWQSAVPRAVWSAVRALVRHPLIAVTLVVAAILLAGSVGEARAAARIETQVAATRAGNAVLRGERARISGAIARARAPAAIIARAERLGYVPATPTPAP